MKYMNLGLGNRHKGATKLNRQSSRSHSILTLKITTKIYKSELSIDTIKTSKMNFVDLAGS